MFWGCMSIHGFGPLTTCEGIMDSEKYVKLLSTELIPELDHIKEHLCSDPIFMQDGAKCHTSKISMDFLNSHSIETLFWPPQSPDLNPIELIWNTLKIKLRSDYPFPKNQHELQENVFKAYSEFDHSDAKKYIERLPMLLQRIIANGGSVVQ